MTFSFCLISNHYGAKISFGPYANGRRRTGSLSPNAAGQQSFQLIGFIHRKATGYQLFQSAGDGIHHRGQSLAPGCQTDKYPASVSGIGATLHITGALHLFDQSRYGGAGPADTPGQHAHMARAFRQQMSQYITMAGSDIRESRILEGGDNELIAFFTQTARIGKDRSIAHDVHIVRYRTYCQDCPLANRHDRT